MIIDLFFQIGGLEGEQELLDMVLPQLVYAAGIDGAAQELVHFVLWVKRLLSATADAEQKKRRSPRLNV